MISGRLLALSLATLVLVTGVLYFGYYLPERARLDEEVESARTLLAEAEGRREALVGLRRRRDALRTELEELTSEPLPVVEGTTEEVARWLAGELRSAGVVLVSLRPIQEGSPSIDVVAEGRPSAFGRLFVDWLRLQSDWQVRSLTLTRGAEGSTIRGNLRLGRRETVQ